MYFAHALWALDLLELIYSLTENGSAHTVAFDRFEKTKAIALPRRRMVAFNLHLLCLTTSKLQCGSMVLSQLTPYYLSYVQPLRTAL